MIQSIAKTMTRKAEIPERKGPVSLNADQRKTEIFRIMKENHRLLDRLENLEPIVSTAELMSSNKDRTRYRIMVSHSKRLAGEYDSDVERIRLEDQAKTDAMNRSLQARMTKYEKQRLTNGSGSNSMPSLTPMAATDPGVISRTPASPAPAPPKKRVARQLGAPGGLASSSSSSKSSPPLASQKPGAAADVTVAAQSDKEKRDSKVSFEGGNIETQSDKRNEWQRKGGPTPHPKKASTAEELFYEASESPTGDTAAPPAATAAADAPAAATPVGVAGPASPEVAAAGSPQDASQSYQDDFADETLNSQSKGPDETLETSAATFEESRDG
jgi:hypothetical protein